MKIIEKNPGTKIDYALNGTRLDFADGALTIDMARYQADEEVTRDIMIDNEGYLTMGRGRYYAAQVEIPAREYEEVPGGEDEGGESGTDTERRPLPLDTGKVTLYLFAIDGIIIH